MNNRPYKPAELMAAIALSIKDKVDRGIRPRSDYERNPRQLIGVIKDVLISSLDGDAGRKYKTIVILLTGKVNDEDLSGEEIVTLWRWLDAREWHGKWLASYNAIVEAEALYAEAKAGKFWELFAGYHFNP